MAKFTEIFEDVTKKGVKIPSNLYLDTGLYPIIDQGQSAIAGYTNKADGLFFDVPAIIFGDHTRIFKYVEKPCFLGADGVKLLKAKKPNANHKYLYYALCNADIPNTGYNRHFKWLKEVDIPEYSEEEQEDIVLKLDKISHLIALRKRQLSKLDELVKSQFVEMFGDIKTNSKKFASSTLKDICDSYFWIMPQTPRYIENGEIPYITSKNIKGGRIEFKGCKYISRDDYNILTKNRDIKSGDFLISMIGTLGEVSVVQKQDGLFYGQNIFLLRLKKDINSQYVLSYLTNTDYVKHWWDKCKNSSTQSYLKSGHITGLKILLPPLSLQQEFAAFVEKVDKLEFKAKASLENLETLKKAMMQKYFN